MPKKLPSNKGGGINLFTIDMNTLSEQIRSLLSDPIKGEFVKLGFAESVEEVEQKLVAHYQKTVSLMKRQNKPIGGSTSREPMPQTDSPAGSKVKVGGGTPAALEPLEKGEVDWRPPHATKRDNK